MTRCSLFRSGYPSTLPHFILNVNITRLLEKDYLGPCHKDWVMPGMTALLMPGDGPLASLAKPWPMRVKRQNISKNWHLKTSSSTSLTMPNCQKRVNLWCRARARLWPILFLPKQPNSFMKGCLNNIHRSFHYSRVVTWIYRLINYTRQFQWQWMPWIVWMIWLSSCKNLEQVYVLFSNRMQFLTLQRSFRNLADMLPFSLFITSMPRFIISSADITMPWANVFFEPSNRVWAMPGPLRQPMLGPGHTVWLATSWPMPVKKHVLNIAKGLCRIRGKRVHRSRFV